MVASQFEWRRSGIVAWDFWVPEPQLVFHGSAGLYFIMSMHIGRHQVRGEGVVVTITNNIMILFCSFFFC